MCDSVTYMKLDIKHFFMKWDQEKYLLLNDFGNCLFVMRKCDSFSSDIANKTGQPTARLRKARVSVSARWQA